MKEQKEDVVYIEVNAEAYETFIDLLESGELDSEAVMNLLQAKNPWE